MKYFAILISVFLISCDCEPFQANSIDISKIKKIHYVTEENINKIDETKEVPPLVVVQTPDYSMYRYQVAWVYQSNGSTQYYYVYCNKYEINSGTLFVEPKNDSEGRSWLVYNGNWVISPNPTFNPER